MVRQVNLYEAKTQLSQLVEDAARGEEIVIAKNGKPMVKLVAASPSLEDKPMKRALGQWANLMTPEERAYHNSERFERDWKEWDAEIERDFECFQDEPREYDSAWPATSSTPTPSSEPKKIRKPSAGKRAKR